MSKNIFRYILPVFFFLVVYDMKIIGQCRYNDSLELVKLYKATNGANWTIKWDLSQPLSMWYGVQLNDQGCVTCIDLDGTPDCNFSFATGNGLTGTLPNLNLPQLSSLFLNNNKITSNIPNFNLPQLIGLYLSNNLFTGTIPNFNLPNLNYLRLDNNQLSSTIPNFNLPNLRFLILESNKLSGNISNFNLPNLVQLDLNNNNLSGSIPNFNFPNLQLLTIEQNQLTGNITNLNLPNLEILNLGLNQLSGLIPNFILPNLQELYLYNNQLTGTIPNFIFPKLTGITLAGNQLSGNIPNFNFPNLIRLALNGNLLTGSIPDFNFPNIQKIYLYNNQLSGCLPKSLKNYCNVQVDISNNPFLKNQNFANFCSSGLGVCADSVQVCPSTVAVNAVTICTGQTITLPNGKIVSKSGVYSDTLKNFKGCDSIVTTNLSFYSIPNAVEDIYTIKETDEYIDINVLENDSVGLSSSFSVVKSNLDSSLTDLSNGKFRFTPTTTMRGTQQIFSYKLCSSNCKNICDTALVTLNILGASVNIGKTFNGLTPDANENRYLEIENIAQFPENELKIYNKWGELVFRLKNYDNKWNGTDQNNAPLPPDNYYYVFTVFNNNTSTEKKGFVLIAR